MTYERNPVRKHCSLRNCSGTLQDRQGDPHHNEKKSYSQWSVHSAAVNKIQPDPHDSDLHRHTKDSVHRTVPELHYPDPHQGNELPSLLLMPHSLLTLNAEPV